MKRVWLVSAVLVVLSVPAAARCELRERVIRVIELNEMAEAFFRGGDYRSSIRVMERAQSLIPARFRLYNLAVCYERLGDLGRMLAANDPAGPARWLEMLRRLEDA